MLRIPKHADEFATGTCLQGYVYTTYDKLVEALGLPNARGDGYKVDAEWVLTSSEGPVTIYNYKDGKNYLGEEGLDVSDITEWHIGGLKPEVCDVVQNELPNATVRKG